MGEHDLATLLRDAEPPGDHRPDVAALWHAGRRRARRTRAARAAGAAAVVVAVIGAALVVTGGDDGPQVLDVVGPPPESAEPASTEPLPVVPEPGPAAPPGGHRPVVDGFPVQLRIDRTHFVVDGDPDAEVGLVAPVEDAEPVTVAIPFTIDSWDPATSTWFPAVDLYDMSRAERPSWQPHGYGSAWYERTKGAWGFPVIVPTQDLAPGTYRLCVQAWRSVDDPVAGSGGAAAQTWGVAPNLPALAVPPSAERLCVGLTLADSDPVPSDPVPPTAAELAAAPQLEIPRLGVRAPILRATGMHLADAVGLVDGTPRPGDPGTSVLVGHRTTWRADFLDLDQLRPGDRFFVVDGDRGIELEVTARRIVPAAGEATGPTWGIPAAELAQDGDPAPRVRLVTFEPRYSAAQRLIVDAVEVASRP